MEDPLEDLLKDALAALQKRSTRRDNPYVADLIGVLRPYGTHGLARQKALAELERRRREKGLPVPRMFDEATQSTFNQHCVSSKVFQSKGIPADGLFTSRKDGQQAIWILNPARADAWLHARSSRGKRS